MVTPVQTEHVRTANRHSVYRALARRGAATRAEIAAETGLSAPTVAAILGDLGLHGLVADAGSAVGTGGRPARRVRFVADAAHVLAVDLSGRHAHACVVALDGSVRHRAGGPALGPDRDDALMAWLRERLADPTGARVRRLALAVPGVVDPAGGHVDLAPALGWYGRPLAAQLEASLGVDVTLENDVNALALAELHYGVGADQRHVLYLAIASGLGAGIVVDGQLYRGAHAAAGEIGSSAVVGDPDAYPPTHHRGPGALEARVVAAAERCLDARGVVTLDGEAQRRAFRDLVGLLAPTLHNLACLLDPGLVVVTWPPDRDARLAHALREAWTAPWPVTLAAGTLGRDGAARGAAHLALHRLEAEHCAPRPYDEPGATHATAAPTGHAEATHRDRSRHA